MKSNNKLDNSNNNANINVSRNQYDDHVLNLNTEHNKIKDNNHNNINTSAHNESRNNVIEDYKKYQNSVQKTSELKQKNCITRFFKTLYKRLCCSKKINNLQTQNKIAHISPFKPITK